MEELLRGALGEDAADGIFRLLEVPVRREGGLGVTLASHGRVTSLVPGGAAEIDGHLQPGDVIGWVDRRWVGNQPLTAFVPPGRAAFRFTLLRPIRGPELDSALRLFPPVNGAPVNGAACTRQSSWTAPAARAATLPTAPHSAPGASGHKLPETAGAVHGVALAPGGAGLGTQAEGGARAAISAEGARAMSQAEMEMLRGHKATGAGGRASRRGGRGGGRGGGGRAGTGGGGASETDPRRHCGSGKAAASGAAGRRRGSGCGDGEEASSGESGSSEEGSHSSSSEGDASCGARASGLRQQGIRPALPSVVAGAAPQSSPLPNTARPPGLPLPAPPPALTAGGGVRSRTSPAPAGGVPAPAGPLSRGIRHSLGLLPPLSELGSRGEDEAHTAAMDDAELGGSKYGPAAGGPAPLLVLWDVPSCPLEGMHDPEAGEQQALRLRFRAQTLAGSAPCVLLAFTTTDQMSGPASWLARAVRERDVLGKDASLVVLDSEAELSTGILDELYPYVCSTVAAGGASGPAAILITARPELARAVGRMMLRGLDVALAAPLHKAAGWAPGGGADAAGGGLGWGADTAEIGRAHV